MVDFGCGPVWNHTCWQPLWTQFDDIVDLAVVFLALLSRSIRFQIFGNLKDICLMMGEVSLETSPKNIMIQDTIKSENSMYTTESTNTNNIFKSRLVDHRISQKTVCIQLNRQTQTTYSRVDLLTTGYHVIKI